MNKLDPRPPVAAMTTTMGIAYIICALLLSLYPANVINFFNRWFHGIDLTKIASKSITFSSFILGFIELIITTTLLTLFFVWIYNLCIEHCKK